MKFIANNWSVTRDRIERAASSVGRVFDDIEVVAVTKTRSVAEIEYAYECGFKIMGENRVQEAQSKKSSVSAEIKWHMIGGLQSNKAGKVVELFDMVQSVDRLDLAEALDRRAAKFSRRLDILIQVNTKGISRQGGVLPDAVPDLVGQISEFSFLRICGLMTIAPNLNDECVIRDSFATVRSLWDQLHGLSHERIDMRYLSMGMSSDFEWAIAEGANLLRLGTAIFGQR